MKKFSPETFAKSLGLSTSVSNPKAPPELYFDLWETDRDQGEDTRIDLTHGALYTTAYPSVANYYVSGPNNSLALSVSAKTLALLKWVPEGVACSDKIVYVVFDSSDYAEDLSYLQIVILRSRRDARNFVAFTKKRMTGRPSSSSIFIAKYCLQGV